VPVSPATYCFLLIQAKSLTTTQREESIIYWIKEVAICVASADRGMCFGVNDDDIKKQGLLHHSYVDIHTKPSLQLVAPIVSLEQNVFSLPISLC
jgi:hypothetical protein